MPSISEAINNGSELYIKQKKNWGEILLNFEARNRYEIFDANQNLVGSLKETGSKLSQFLSRLFLRSHRGFQIEVKNDDESSCLVLKRKFFFFFSDLFVFNEKQNAIGSIHRRFGLIYKRYDLRDSVGNTFATIESPIWRLWSFPLCLPDKTKLADAGVFKKWTGVLREIFTDSDSFLVRFGSYKWTLDQKLLILACAISIDFDFFEDNQRN